MHHYALHTVKARNESSACVTVVMYESVTVSAVRSLALDASSGINLCPAYYRFENEIK